MASKIAKDFFHSICSIGHCNVSINIKWPRHRHKSQLFLVILASISILWLYIPTQNQAPAISAPPISFYTLDDCDEHIASKIRFFPCHFSTNKKDLNFYVGKFCLYPMIFHCLLTWAFWCRDFLLNFRNT